VNAARRGRLDDRQVLCDGAKGNDGFGFDCVQHTLEVGVHETPVETELLGVALHQITVRLVDPHRLDIAPLSASQDPGYMAVRETGYYDSHRSVSELLHKKGFLLFFAGKVFSASLPPLHRRGARANVCR
jgi:hypothetical protein